MKSLLPNLPDDHLKAIAHVAIRSAQLDSMIEVCVAGLLTQSINLAENMLKDARADKQISIIKSILLDRHDGFTVEINRFIEEIIKIRRERNEVIHFVWGSADEEGVAQAASIRAFKQDKWRSFTHSQVWDISDQLLSAVTDLTVVTHWSNVQFGLISHEDPRLSYMKEILRLPGWPLTPNLPWRVS